MPLIDTLKAVASQLIVLHHLAFYGPMSDAAYPLLADGIDWLYNYGRMAVQVFLVVAGFLAARSLTPGARDIHPERLTLARYRRLVAPFLVAMLAAIASSALAGLWLDHPSVSPPPTLLQLVSHALLLHGVLGQESLSAGAWYVAIDFQLYAMLVLSLWLTQRGGEKVTILLIGLLTLLSLFHFNRNADWDNWGLYFFGSYALGILARWSTARRQHALRWLVATTLIAILALLIDFRLRIAIALATALLLGLGEHSGLQRKWPDFPLIAWLGKISYSLFLIHFPVCLLVSAAINHWAPGAPSINLAGMGLAWLLSVTAGGLFYHLVEKPFASLGARRNPSC